ncbi:MAG: AAA family ATPase, partial [Myxococcota bacterium]
MAQLVADHGSVVVVHGPRGVGKARLAVALKTEATRRGDAAVLEARCPSAGARSFHPFSDLARQAMVWAEERGLTETLVDPIYPELSAVIDHAVSDRSSTETPSLDQKLAFFEAFRQLLTGVGREGRLCVIIHDVERADADTLEMAAFLADELFGDAALTGRPVRGVLVLLARDDVPGRIEDFVAEMNDRPSARTMGLRGLDLDGLRRYVQSPHVLEKLLEASAGLPQEVDALIDALPSNVEELFERRLESLDALPRELLLAMSVSDRPASARLLAEIVRHPMKEAALALNGLRSDRILTRRIQSGEFQFSFNRRRDQEVAQRALSPEDRAHLHGSWARALSQEHETGGPALLAYHQLRSSEPQRGVPLAVQAAETHAVAGAIHAALEILEDARPHATGELKLTILARLAELAPLTGNPRRALRLVEEWKTSLAEDQRAPALRREGELHNAAGDYHRALEALAGARLLFEAAPDQLNLARVDATASEAHYHLAETQLARECCEAGLERLATARRDEATPRLRLDLLNQLGKIALAEGDAERAVKFFEETLDVAGQQALLPEEAR